MGSVATGKDVRTMATEHLEEEARRFTRRTRMTAYTLDASSI